MVIQDCVNHWPRCIRTSTAKNHNEGYLDVRCRSKRLEDSIHRQHEKVEVEDEGQAMQVCTSVVARPKDAEVTMEYEQRTPHRDLLKCVSLDGVSNA